MATDRAESFGWYMVEDSGQHALWIVVRSQMPRFPEALRQNIVARGVALALLAAHSTALGMLTVIA